jgi:Sin3 family co-repressor
VSELFQEHPDLLKEFTFFLPDAVQAQAKVQLDAAAKEAETRKRTKAKNAIMNQAQGMKNQAQELLRPSAASSSPMPPREIHHNQVAPPSGGIAYTAPAPAPVPPPARSTIEREQNLMRSAEHGIVSFEPVRPSRTNEPTPASAAIKSGRPTAIPELSIQPSTSEATFFIRVKEHLSRKELAADRPGSSRKHTPYAEFLKCLHLFGSGVLSKEELIMLLKGLFVQGHAPKSGVNASGGSHNPVIAHEANELMRELDEVLLNRGPYANQEAAYRDKSKYGAVRTRDFDFSNCDHPTPSYRAYPADYPHTLFLSFPWQTAQDAAILNTKLLCIDPQAVYEESEDRSKKRSVPRKRKFLSKEESNGSKKRRNSYEQMLFRIEDERYELDMAIERNIHALRRIEPFAKEAQALREQEEKDGQPIGRLRYQLHRYSMNSIHIGAIGRIYGERGDEILQHLVRNPLVVLPVVYQRLKQKDAEWRKVKAELQEEWNAITEANYEGSLDVQCYFNRKALEKFFSSHRLLDQCKRARSYVKHPEKIKSHPATDAFTPSFGKRAQDAGALLFQSCMETECQVDIAHKYAFQLLTHKVKTDASSTAFERERIGRLWAEFIVPWFQYPSHWVLDEIRQSFGGKLNPNITKCMYRHCRLNVFFWVVLTGVYPSFLHTVVSGMRVATIFGVGTISSFTEPTPVSGPKYRVKLPFGLGHLVPSAILYAMPLKDAPFIRRDGEMVREDPTMEAEENAPRLDPKYKLLFGTQKIYLFIRLYSLLCSVLSDTKSFCDKSPAPVDPADNYISPTKKTEKKDGHHKLDFCTVLSVLKKVLANKATSGELEALGRKVARDRVHQISALPKLIERCTDALRKVAHEDTLLHLYDYCQYSNDDPVAVRSHCLSIVPDAFYRIQLDPVDGTLNYCYLESGSPLLTAPNPDEEEDIEDDTNMDTGDDMMDEDVNEDFEEVMNGSVHEANTKRPAQG